MRTKRWSVRAVAITASLAVAGVALAAAAEQVFVQKPSGTIRQGKGAAYKDTAAVKKGDALTVLERDGKWLRVRTAGGQEGWLAEATVTATKPGGSLADALGSDAAADPSSASAAGKGMEREAIEYANTNHLDRAPLDRLVAAADAIDPADWERFKAEGKVGDARR